MQLFHKLRLTLLIASLACGVFAVGTLVHHTHLSFNVITKAITGASTYYVSMSGSDMDTGTVTSPFKTIAHALSLVSPGDTIILRQGEYNEKVQVSKSGISKQPITLKAMTGENVVLDVHKTTSPVIQVTGSFVTLEGLEIRNSASACVELKGGHDTARNLKVHDCVDHGIYTDGQFITIEGNDVYKTNTENDRSVSGGSKQWGSAIKVRIGGRYISIQNNHVHNNWGEGIAVTRGQNLLVRENTVNDNWGVNIYVDNSKDVRIDHNYSYCSLNSGFERDGQKAAGIAIGEEYYEGWGNQLARVTIINNSVKDCSRGVITFGSQRVGGGLDTVVIQNNVLWNTVQTALSFNEGPSPAKTRNSVISGNTVYQPNGKMVWASSPSGLSFTGNTWSVKPPAYASNNTDIIQKGTFTAPILTVNAP